MKKPLTNTIYLHVKSLEEISDIVVYKNTIKSIYSKPIANLKLGEEKLKAIPLKLGEKHSFSLFPYL